MIEEIDYTKKRVVQMEFNGKTYDITIDPDYNPKNGVFINVFDGKPFTSGLT